MADTAAVKNRIIILLLAILLTVWSYLFLDTAIARYAYRLISTSDRLMQATSDIPDLLLHTVIVITVLCWTGYFFLTHRGVRNRQTHFLKVCGTVVPLAYISKAIFQYGFGRSDPRAWLFDHRLPRFYWFRADAGYGCFPSGHMTVFAALTTTLSKYYPRYRFVFLGMLPLLALALIATYYHFLSDVIAGACLGMLVAFLVDDVLSETAR